MSRLYRFSLFALTLLFTLACGALAAPTATPTATPIPLTDTPAFTATPAATDTPIATDTVAATATPQVATISPLLSAVPGIQMTLTQVFLTPGIENTLVVQQTAAAATMNAGLKNSGATQFLKQCPDPKDPPMQSWLNVPVMPQATAGQRVDTLIGSFYCFRAPVAASDVVDFYKQNLQAPTWVLQSQTDGVMQFFGLSDKGIQLLLVVYGPSSKNDMVVVINVTGAMAIPTFKP